MAGGLAFVLAGAALADPIPAVQSSSNMTIIGHSDLNGAGKGGVRAYSIADPYAAQEIGFIVDAPPKGNATNSIQINDVYVDENGLIYANDRLSGGLDIIRYTGSVPLE